MERLKRYSIPFAGMALGNHQFEYEIDEKFFEAFDNTEIENPHVKVVLNFNKSETVLTLEFQIHGTVSIQCDRCADMFDYPVASTEHLIVRFSDKPSEANDDIITIAHGETHLDVSQHIYDFIMLLIPMKAVHPDNADGTPGCDPEIIKRLNPEEETEQKETDPRWEALKNLSSRKN